MDLRFMFYESEVCGVRGLKGLVGVRAKCVKVLGIEGIV